MVKNNIALKNFQILQYFLHLQYFLQYFESIAIFFVILGKNCIKYYITLRFCNKYCNTLKFCNTKVLQYFAILLQYNTIGTTSASFVCYFISLQNEFCNQKCILFILHLFIHEVLTKLMISLIKSEKAYDIIIIINLMRSSDPFLSLLE